jgi:hypothetical protein
LCGSKTFILKNELKAMGGIYDHKLKCWIFQLDRANDIFKFIEDKRKIINAVTLHGLQPNVDIIPIQTTTHFAPNIIPEQTLARFTPNIYRLSREIIERAQTYDDRAKLGYDMMKRDCDELQPQWSNLLRVVKHVDKTLDKYGKGNKVPSTGNILLRDATKLHPQQIQRILDILGRPYRQPVMMLLLLMMEI